MARNKLAIRLMLAVVAACGLAFRFLGLGRSLWLDEAWVANSVNAESLGGMFHYDSWLQTSPPLFLLLVRMAVQALGFTNLVLRLVPLLFSVLSIALMFLLLCRVLLPRFARLAWALFVLSPLAIQFSKTLKAFSLEVAVTSAVLLACIMYLEQRTVRRHGVLLATVAIGPLLAYSVAFVLPGVILLVGSAAYKRRELLRGLILAMVPGAILLAVYVLCVRPNSSPALRSYWVQDHAGRGFLRMALSDAYSLFYQLPIPRPVLDSALVGAGLAVIFAIGLLLAYLRFRQGRPKWLTIQVLCGVPWILLIVCSGLSLYPMNERMGLFLLPAMVVLFVSNSQLIVEFVLCKAGRRILMPLLDGGLAVIFILLICLSIFKHPVSAQNVPLEDMTSAVDYLHSNIRVGDLLWVHASVSETYKLYTHMTHWNGVTALFGHTGWPCCPRGIDAVKHLGREADVRADLDRAVPANFQGRVWLLYTTRPEHWDFIGIDESRILNSMLSERGCSRQPSPTFQGIGVSNFECTLRPVQ